MNRNTLNHCLKFPLHSIFCHICYGKIYEKIFNTLIKVKLLVSKTSDSCFQGFDFFQMLLAFYKYYKYLISLLSLKENKESSQVGWIPKISVACISCMSCQQTRPISSSRQHRISTQIGMQHHIYLLSSLIISFYILTTNFLCYIFSKGHAMARHEGGVVLQIFLLNVGIFTRFWFHHCFPRWRQSSNFAIWTCKYSLPISNPNILY